MDGPALIARRPLVASAGGRVVARPTLVAGRAAGRVVITGRAARGHVAAVTRRRLVGRRQVAGLAVAGRLAAAALRWRLLRRLAADRLRRAWRSVPALRGRGAFAPRTTRTLGW
ncbi:hypothetical protein [Amycolatopsis sp. NPDC051102]|uniref:hypothetical protein n=1 Tax=Amycolatopsis sp. NPDC051102 TaxID=3155163 RepID=UPI0034438820